MQAQVYRTTSDVSAVANEVGIASIDTATDRMHIEINHSTTTSVACSVLLQHAYQTLSAILTTSVCPHYSMFGINGHENVHE